MWSLCAGPIVSLGLISTSIASSDAELPEGRNWALRPAGVGPGAGQFPSQCLFTVVDRANLT